MLNEILRLLDQHLLFQSLEGERKAEIIREVVQVACREYDCNAGEILQGLGQRFGICYYCLQPADDLKNDMCSRCRNE
jgi:hypothetical protein